MNTNTIHERRTHRRNLLLLALGALTAMAILLYGRIYNGEAGAVPQGPPSDEIRNACLENPIYPAMKRVAAPYGLDVSYMKNIREVHFLGEMVSLPSALFCHKKNSLDVIFFGDSSIRWSLIPQVVEQMTGLKVGVFALRGMYLNAKTLKTLARLRNFYLKKNGLSVFSFHLWTQEKDPGIFRWEDDLSLVANMSDSSFRNFALKRFAQCNSCSEKQAAYRAGFENGGKYLFTEEAYREYEQHIRGIEAFLKEQGGMGLPPRNSLHVQVSNFFNPDWYITKRPKKDTTDTAHQDNAYRLKLPGGGRPIAGSTSWIRWDARSIIKYQGTPQSRSMYSNEPFDPAAVIPGEAVTNAKALLSFPGRKAYVICLYSEQGQYRKARTYYERLYRGHLECIDLGKHHPRSESFPMDNLHHLVNEGTLQGTILLGTWLKAHY
ncbi:MAG TPA: hypothetical protein PK544_17870 [Spirochaetota bacterium]|nr:hypothetical protein [Spirochaetota bacterium]